MKAKLEEQGAAVEVTGNTAGSSGDGFALSADPRRYSHCDEDEPQDQPLVPQLKF